jgi:ADP-heptose:LPS heptosyltransferase
MARNKRLLLLRFSALGDVLMTVPVVSALARQYPDTDITVVSRPFVESIFRRCPDNVDFIGVNLKDYRGIPGLARLVGELCERVRPTHVCDLHDVLRTKLMRPMFRLRGVPTAHIFKDRKARRDFITTRPLTQQQTSFERYAEALARIGFPVVLNPSEPVFVWPERQKRAVGESLRVGIAPFAAHATKIYPLERMEQVVALLSKSGARVYLFGAGDGERELMLQWEARYEGVESVVGTLPDMAAEMTLMASLDVMLTMDSSNMHLAALTPVRLLTLWGATHPLGGFLPWGRDGGICLQRDLPCRPCSIYGSRPCRLGDLRCMDISPDEIVKRLCE